MGRQQPAGGPPTSCRLLCRSTDDQRTEPALARHFPHYRRRLRGNGRADRLAHDFPPARNLTVAGDHPQRDGGPGRPGCSIPPHTSAGRLPTEAGLRLFVHGLLEVGALSEQERENIDVKCATSNRSLPEVLAEASRHAVGPVELRRPGAGAEDRPAAEAYRVRQPRPRPRAGGAGDGGRAGREPGASKCRWACRPPRFRPRPIS